MFALSTVMSPPRPGLVRSSFGSGINGASPLMAEMCQNRTDAPQQTTHAVTRLILFDHLVSLDQDRRRNGQSKVPGDFEIYYELELLGLSDR